MTRGPPGAVPARARRGSAGPRRPGGWIDPAENLALDEELLRAGHPAVRVGLLDSRAFSVGVRSAADRAATRRAERLGFPVLRRSSGGSGLLHQVGDVAWALVFPRATVGRDFVSAYPRLGAGVVDWLAELGLTSEWSVPFALSDSFCLLGPRGRVLTARGRAIGGAAQHATASALLHHGIVNAHLDRPTLARLFELDRPTLDRTVTSLEEEGIDPRREELAERLRFHLAKTLPGPAR
jgi:lipoate-protein ligase A